GLPGDGGVLDQGTLGATCEGEERTGEEAGDGLETHRFLLRSLPASGEPGRSAGISRAGTCCARHAGVVDATPTRTACVELGAQRAVRGRRSVTSREGHARGTIFVGRVHWSNVRRAKSRRS